MTRHDADTWRGHTSQLGDLRGVMEDIARDQATARVEPDGARVLPRRSARADVQDPGFKYTA